MGARKLLEAIYRIGGYQDIFIPEFTFGGKRIDALSINMRKKMVRGYEIKTSRADFMRDKKFQTYSNFCDLLYLVCPENLIRRDEIPDGIGLIYVIESEFYIWKYVKRAKRNRVDEKIFYRILELEMPRLAFDSLCSKCICEIIKRDFRIAHNFKKTGENL